MITISPIELTGSWNEGFALDVHTIKSEYTGEGPLGPEFKTKRSDIGELLYQLKSNSNQSVVPNIVEVVCDFIVNRWESKPRLEGIIAVPPSKTRYIQPVIKMAEEISLNLEIPFINCLTKAKKTPELKNMDDYDKRIEALKDAYSLKKDSNIRGMTVLLFDDLYRSGITLNCITQILREKGEVARVYVLTLTKTRTKR